MELFGEVENER